MGWAHSRPNQFWRRRDNEGPYASTSTAASSALMYPNVNACQPLAYATSGFQGGEELVETVLGVAEKHQAFFVVVEVVVHAGEARPHAPLEHDDRPGPVDLQNRH